MDFHPDALRCITEVCTRHDHGTDSLKCHRPLSEAITNLALDFMFVAHLECT
jgi:hypothetical protein